jgi:predicted membrane protein
LYRLFLKISKNSIFISREVLAINFNLLAYKYKIDIIYVMKELKQEIIVNHLKNYGFVYPCSEIYGGIANG